MRELATGEIFTADQAKETGLIDELGDIDDADRPGAVDGGAGGAEGDVRAAPPRACGTACSSNTATTFSEMVVWVAGGAAAGAADRVPLRGSVGRQAVSG